MGIMYNIVMRIIARRTLKEFWEKPKNKGSEQLLRAWFSEVRKANWKNTNQIKEQYKSASIVGNDRVVFNIKGNEFRLIVAIRFEFQLIYIRFVGTHNQYDKVNAKEI